MLRSFPPLRLFVVLEMGANGHFPPRERKQKHKEESRCSVPSVSCFPSQGIISLKHAATLGAVTQGGGRKVEEPEPGKMMPGSIQHPKGVKTAVTESYDGNRASKMRINIVTILGWWARIVCLLRKGLDMGAVQQAHTHAHAALCVAEAILEKDMLTVKWCSFDGCLFFWHCRALGPNATTGGKKNKRLTSPKSHPGV